MQFLLNWGDFRLDPQNRWRMDWTIFCYHLMVGSTIMIGNSPNLTLSILPCLATIDLISYFILCYDVRLISIIGLVSDVLMIISCDLISNTLIEAHCIKCMCLWTWYKWETIKPYLLSFFSLSYSTSLLKLLSLPQPLHDTYWWLYIDAQYF